VTDVTGGGGREHRARQAWLAASSAWAQHIIDCDACYVGEPCPDEPDMFRRVVTTFSAVTQHRGGGSQVEMDLT
jgi:hypothetical protein